MAAGHKYCSCSNLWRLYAPLHTFITHNLMNKLRSETSSFGLAVCREVSSHDQHSGSASLAAPHRAPSHRIP